MRTGWLLLFATLVVSRVASGQDWQHYKPDGSSSFAELKDAVRRDLGIHGYSGWDEKAFSRGGDFTALAIVQSVSDPEISTPENLKVILLILRLAFECPHTCVQVTGDQQPRVALLLLEHLHRTVNRAMKSQIEETKRFVLQQAGSVK
jgi:hypothetical protein